jgi:hypothetical protein
MGLAALADGDRSPDAFETLVVFGEDVTRHGIGDGAARAKLETLVVSDILAQRDDPAAAHYLLLARVRAMRKSGARSSPRRVGSSAS